jgi:hypothetical protein
LTSCGKLRRASLVPSAIGFLSLAAATDQRVPLVVQVHGLAGGFVGMV